jgi:hypothetical protein
MKKNKDKFNAGHEGRIIMQEVSQWRKNNCAGSVTRSGRNNNIR